LNVNPYLALDLLQDLTTIRLKYEYDARWYADRSENEWDQTHQVKLGLNHRFTECYTLDVFDSFVVGQEPSVLTPSAAPGFANFYRVDGSNLRNYGGVALNMKFTEQLGSRLQYANTYYDYEDSGDGSLSALLDRINHTVTADVRWGFNPTTVGLFGYQFEDVGQLSSDSLVVGQDVPANLRDRQSHFFFIGGNHDLAVKHLVNWRAGVQYADYPNATDGMTKDKWLPYIDAMYQYLLAENSRVQFGLRHQMYQSDVVTQDTATSTVYAAVTYDITPRLTGMLRGNLQFSEFNGGPYDEDWDCFYTADINLKYEINRYLDAEVGYAWDRLDSDIGIRRYTRNRVYFGFIGKY
jgi:hypothetical protein